MNKIATLAAALLMTSAASAQTAATWVEIEDDAMQVTALNVTVDQLEDMHVFNAAGEDIGEVEDVLGTEPGTPTAIAIDLDDGLFNDKTIIVDISELTIADGRVVTQLTQEQIEALPDQDD